MVWGGGGSRGDLASSDKKKLALTDKTIQRLKKINQEMHSFFMVGGGEGGSRGRAEEEEIRMPR